MPITTWAGYKDALETAKSKSEHAFKPATATPFQSFQHQLFLNQINICVQNVDTVVAGMTHPNASVANPEWYALVNTNETTCVTEAVNFLNRRYAWMINNVYGKVVAIPALNGPYPIQFSQLAAQSKYNGGQLKDLPVDLATLQKLMADNGIAAADTNKAVGVVCMFLPANTGIVNNPAPLLVAINNRSLAGNVILNVAPYQVMIAPPTVEEFKLRMSAAGIEIKGAVYTTVYTYNTGVNANLHIAKATYTPPYSTIFLSNTIGEINKDSIVAQLQVPMTIT